MDTFQANEALGHQRDSRSFDVAADMLASQGWSSIRLLTNNPDKVFDLERMGLEVVEVVPFKWSPTNTTADIFRPKARK